MEKRINHRRTLAIWFLGILSLMVTGSCMQQDVITSAEEEAQEAAVMRISVRAAVSTLPGTSAENKIRTLRVFFFKENGSLFATQYYETANVMAGIPTDPKKAHDYFIKQGDSYIISILFKNKMPLRVVVVANELKSMAGVTTLEGVRDAKVDFADTYGSGGSMDIRIDATSTSSNVGYIPMYAETGLLTAYDWDASNGGVISLPLVRLLAKVSVKLHESEKANLSSGETITISSVSIGSLPLYTQWQQHVYLQADLITTVTKNFSNPITIEGGKPTTQETDIVEFYIPEHMIRDLMFQNDQYSFIQINALYATNGTSMSSTYKIPLGDGVKKLTGVTENDIKTLTQSDLNISRNTWFQVDAGIATKGKLEIQEIKVQITDWNNVPVDVDGGMDVPLLNISTQDVWMSAKTVDVHFWTNQEKPYIDEVCVVNGNPNALVNTVFESLAGEGATNFSLHTAEQNQDYYPYNGYIRFKLANVDDYDKDNTYLITMHSGSLRRTIQVRTNPKVGEIIFNPNGGAEAAYVYSIQYKDLAPNGAEGDKMSITTHPFSISPPSFTNNGMRLLWVYESTNAPVVDDGAGKLLITLTGYTTRIKAVWY